MNETAREMTLAEYVAQLPEHHAARKEYEVLKERDASWVGKPDCPECHGRGWIYHYVDPKNWSETRCERCMQP